MKLSLNYISSVLCVLVLFSCTEDESRSKEDEGLSNGLIPYDSALITEDSIDLNAVFTDTLEFVYYYDEYDDPIIEAVTQSGDTITMISDVVFDLDTVPSKSMIAIQWKLDSVYLAGEGEKLYYQEHVLSYELIERAPVFEEELRDYFNHYASNDQTYLEQKFIHPDFEISNAYNPGAACVLMGYEPGPDIRDPEGWLISDEMPQGDFCEGYPNVQNGLYYEVITTEELPYYADVTTDDWKPVQPELPALDFTDIMKVTVVYDEWHYAYWYFLIIDNRPYIWLVDRCDCSA